MTAAVFLKADLSYEAPPLGLDGAEHGEAGSRPARARFNRRWLSATGLMGGVALALMCGALFASITRDSRHVVRPVLAGRRSGVEKPRGDRLHTQQAQADASALKREVKVEQLTASGMHAFVHLATKLATVVAAAADQPPAPRPRPPLPAEDGEMPDAGADVPPPMAANMSAHAVASARRAGLKAAHTRVAEAQAAAAAALEAMARHPNAAPPPPPTALGFAPPPPPPSHLPPEILTGASLPPPPTPAPPPQEGPPAPSLAMFEDDLTAIGEPVNVSVLAKHPHESATVDRVLVAKPGDAPEDMLRAAGLDSEDAQVLATALRKAAMAGKPAFAGGEELVLSEPKGEESARPPRPIKASLARAGKPVARLVATDAGAYVPMPDAPPVAASALAEGEVDPSLIDGLSIRDGLYKLADAHVVDEGMVEAILRLAEHDVDLDAPLGAEDSIDLVYGPPDRNDNRPEAFQQDIAFVRLKADGKERRYYRFRTADDGATDYYDSDGHSVTKMLLRKPFAAGRLNDGFGWRIHPILHDRRFHNGVDYTGPAGSPIVAAGAGVVEKIDYEWGYGKYVRVRHDGGYETTYAHVEGFPSGLKVGQRVRQGQVIAYVGSTGLSTGPHLYYELRINGHYADPTRVKLAGGRILQGDLADAFRKERARMDALAAAVPTPAP